MSADTWLKLHTSLLTSAKFCNLPSNEHRWAFICLLLLSKKGLESAPERLTLGHLFMSKKRWKTVRADLIEAGLLDANGSVNGFEDSQLSFNALRQRRYKERHNGVTDGVTSNAKTVTDAEADAEAEKNKNPPTPRKRGRAPSDYEQTAIHFVVSYLATVTGRNFSSERANDEILRALRAGDPLTMVADCCAVIDYLWAKWKDDPKMVGFVNKTTPFRKANFDRYLDEAKAVPKPADELDFEPEPWRN